MDRKYTTEVIKRAPLLDALRDGPAEASELERRLSMSRSTIHRATRSFVEWGLLTKTDGVFQLTNFGHVVADRVAGFRAQLDAAAQLESYLNTVESPPLGLPLEQLGDATITNPKAGMAHVGVKRLTDLMADSTSLRMFSSVVSPIYVDLCYREALNGMEIAAIFDRRVVELLFSEYGSKSREAAREGQFEVRIHDDCPFELFLFDDCVGITAHDESGNPCSFLESTNPEVIAWGEQLYERYESEAEYATMI